MQKVIIDANIIIDFTRNADLFFETLLHKSAAKQVKLFIPSIVVAELMVGQETKTKEKFEKLEILVNRLKLVQLNYELAKLAGSLVRDYPSLKLADAIVAATALSLNAKLATRNIKDFQDVKGLKFFKLDCILTK